MNSTLGLLLWFGRYWQRLPRVVLVTLICATLFCINVIFIFLVFPRLALGLHLHHLFTGWSDLCLVFYNKTACLRLNYNKMVTFLPLKRPVKHYCLIILMCVVKLPHGFIGPCIPNLLLTISLHSLEIHDEAWWRIDTGNCYLTILILIVKAFVYFLLLQYI